MNGLGGASGISQ